MVVFAPYDAIQSTVVDDEQLLKVSVEVLRDVNSFSGLVIVAEGLQSIDGFLRSEFTEQGLTLRNDLLGARAKLTRFRVNSDPVAEFIANHAWMAILVTAVVMVRDYARF